MARLSKFRKTRQTTPRGIIMQTFFHGNPGKKKRRIRKFTSPIRTALKRRKRDNHGSCPREMPKIPYVYIMTRGFSGQGTWGVA